MRKLLLFLFALLLLQQAFSQAGTLDTSYGNNGVTAVLPRSTFPYGSGLVVQPDGKAVVVGNVDPEGDAIGGAVRYTTKGVLDKTYSRDGVATDADVDVFYASADIAVQRDGKVLLTGQDYHSEQTAVVVRLNKNGTRDSSFGSNGKVDLPYGFNGLSIVEEANGKIVVAINIDGSTNFAFAILNPDGSLHSHSEVATSFYDAHPQVSAYADGGYVLSYAKSADSVVVYSTRFGEKHFAGYSSDYLTRHAILKNGKIALLAVKNGKSNMVLLNANGTLDTGFDGDGYLQLSDFVPYSIVGDPSGKIISQGQHTGNGFGLMRFNVDGTVDTGFGTDGFVQSHANSGCALAVYGNRLFELNIPNWDGGAATLAAYILNADPRYVKVNLYGNDDPYNNREWNNWNNLKNLHFNNFYYSDSTISNISGVMSNRNGVNDNGADYGSGMAPAGVLRHSSYSIGSRTVTLSGLAVAKKYSIELYASRNAYNTDSTVFSINGVLKKIGTYRNFTNKASFSNLSPNAQGQIVITISSTRMYNYLDGFVLTESYPSTNTQASNSITSVQRCEAAAEEGTLQIKVFPNPARQLFTLQLKGTNQPVQVRVIDASGRVVETRQNSAPNATIVIGQQYKPGVYYIEVKQGSIRNVVKLVKEAE